MGIAVLKVRIEVYIREERSKCAPSPEMGTTWDPHTSFFIILHIRVRVCESQLYKNPRGLSLIGHRERELKA